jgi:hydrogenase maturation protease
MPGAGRPGDAVPARPRYAVLGLGSLLQGDEALGGHVIARLDAEPGHLGALPDPALVELVDGGTVGLGLVPRLAGLDGLVVVDIVDAAVPPGTLIDLDGAAILARQAALGVHELGAGELLGALLFMDQLPRRVRVVGIQPAVIALGTELSPLVAAGLGDVVATVAGHLADWQAEDGVAPG